MPPLLLLLRRQPRGVLARNRPPAKATFRAHGRPILPQRFDRQEGLRLSGASPIRLQLRPVQLTPLHHETQCPSRKVALQKTYPNGKIYVGMDLTDTITAFDPR